MSDVRKRPRVELTFDNERAFERHVIHVAAPGSVEEIGRLIALLKTRGELRLVCKKVAEVGRELSDHEID